MDRPAPKIQAPNNQKWLIQKLLLRLLRNWPWITIAVVISMASAFLINRYSYMIFETQVRVVKGSDDNSSNGAAFILGSARYNTALNTEYERAFFTATPVLEKVITDLNLQVSYFSEGYVKTYERYGELPITVIYDPGNKNIPFNISFRIIKNDAGFYLSSDEDTWRKELSGRKFEFDKELEIFGFKFTIRKNFPIENRGDWIFVINRISDLTSYYKNNLRLDVSSQNGKEAMLRISILTSVPEKEKAILNRLVEEIRFRDVQRKVESSGLTLNFINSQLETVADSMELLAKKLRDQKLNNKELSAGSTAVFSRISELENKKAEYVLSNQYCDYLENYITSRSNEDIIVPSVMGIENSLLNDLLGQYVEMRLKERNEAQLNLSSRVYKKEREQREKELSSFEDVVLESIVTTKHSNQMQIEECEQQIQSFLQSARATMNEEIIYNDNQRLYKLNESVFNLLMDKKAEAGISRAALISDYRQLESAFYSKTPLEPKPSKNFIIALVLGLLIPIAFFFERTVSNNTLLSLSELEELIKIPVLGIIGNNPNPTVVKDESKSLVAENFRTLRSNLKYIKEDKMKLVLLVTSSISGEGKSFITSNLGYALGLQGKKTIVIGADLRKPTLKTYFGTCNTPGLSEYLSSQAEIGSIICQSNDPNLYFILAGPIPPNPAELLSNHRMTELILKLREDFEFVLIDTPPIGTISDASELFGISDAILLVTRQERTPIAALQQLNYFFDKESLTKTVTVFNGFNTGTRYGYYGYRYGYGYGYGEYYKN